MSKRKIFVSYDTAKDERLKEVFAKILERPDSPFVAAGYSTPITEPVRTWEYNTGKAIQGCEIVIILTGPTTAQAPGVLKEVEMAFDEEIPMIQVLGYKNIKVNPIRRAGQLIPWSWETLKNMV
ncbi:MAG: hypothetical protein AB1921_16290 [Thermodesulfobacteriota bacterium]